MTFSLSEMLEKDIRNKLGFISTILNDREVFHAFDIVARITSLFTVLLTRNLPTILYSLFLISSASCSVTQIPLTQPPSS